MRFPYVMSAESTSVYPEHTRRSLIATLAIRLLSRAFYSELAVQVPSVCSDMWLKSQGGFTLNGKCVKPFCREPGGLETEPDMTEMTCSRSDGLFGQERFRLRTATVKRHSRRE